MPLRVLTCWIVVTICIHTPGFSQTCSNWLGLTSFPSNVTVGDLDVPGHLITVEAMINSSVNTTSQGRDIVSKHESPADVNYLLRPDYASITTSNGFYQTPTICPVTIGKTYHVAMTYDGATLKFYRNGFLMSQIAATGDLYQNDFITAIGEYSQEVLNSQFEGYINEVRIWNVVRTQAQLQQYMNVSLPSPSAQTGLLAYYTFDDLTNKQGNPAWNGALNGSGIAINQINPNCSFVADSCGILACSFVTDFSYATDACTPLMVSLSPGASVAGTVYSWTISDGATYMNQANPTHTFAQPGTYQITLLTTLPSGCSASVTKSIIVGTTPADIIITPNTSICPGKTVPLQTLPLLDFCWSPVTGLDNPQSPTPNASPQATTTYYLTAITTGPNLVANGNFDMGDVDFTSAYQYASVNTTEGQYFVGPNPAAWNLATNPCGDHTTGSGNMLMINGSPQAGLTAWATQPIAVTPNTNYAFSLWITSIDNDPPQAIMQFYIDGIPLGNSAPASSTACSWNMFYATWNSGNNTSATISLIDQVSSRAGNDFALDDISFALVSVQADSVIVNVDTPHVSASPADTSICPGMPVLLQASGSASYTWSPATGLSSTAVANPTLLLAPSATGTIATYTVTGTSAIGCTADTSITITQYPSLITISPDTLVCRGDAVQLHAGGGGTYQWSPAALLNDPASPDPTTLADSSVRFILMLTDINQCVEQDSVNVRVKPVPVFDAPPGQNDCSGYSVGLKSSNPPGYVYSWSPATGLNDPSTPYPIASPTSNITYTLMISDSLCPRYDSSFAVAITVIPSPVVTVTATNIDCAIHTSQLKAAGATTYSWTPTGGLSDPYSPTPVATIDTTTTFIVKGTDDNGCYTLDSVVVKVTSTGANTFVVPNAFSPNGDGKNDCFGVSRWGDVQLEEFMIFDRWGARVFDTRNPNDCWDGTFRGKPQPPGAYPYIIKAHTFCGEITRQGLVMLIR
jgi:gliding motility-associated-like protein